MIYDHWLQVIERLPLAFFNPPFICVLSLSLSLFLFSCHVDSDVHTRSCHSAREIKFVSWRSEDEATDFTLREAANRMKCQVIEWNGSEKSRVNTINLLAIEWSHQRARKRATHMLNVNHSA